MSVKVAYLTIRNANKKNKESEDLLVYDPEEYIRQNLFETTVKAREKTFLPGSLKCV